MTLITAQWRLIKTLPTPRPAHRRPPLARAAHAAARSRAGGRCPSPAHTGSGPPGNRPGAPIGALRLSITRRVPSLLAQHRPPAGGGGAGGSHWPPPPPHTRAPRPPARPAAGPRALVIGCPPPAGAGLLAIPPSRWLPLPPVRHPPASPPPAAAPPAPSRSLFGSASAAETPAAAA